MNQEPLLFDDGASECLNPDKRRRDAISAVDELVRSALAYHTPDRFRELMEFTARLPKVAPFNAMLLHVQNPSTKYVATVRGWAEIGRTIKPGSRPMVIMKLMGPVSFVFDVGDTEGEPLPSSVEQEIEDPFAVEGSVSQAEWKTLCGTCPPLRIEIAEATLPESLAGDIRTVSSDDSTKRHLLRLNASHTREERFATLAHEIGHLFCGHLGGNMDEFWHDRRNTDLATRELEAEAVAYLVGRRRGLKLASSKYLSLYLSPGAALPNFSLEHILTSTAAVEEMAKGRIPNREKSRRRRAAQALRRAAQKKS